MSGDRLLCHDLGGAGSIQEVEAMGAVEQGRGLPVTKKDLSQMSQMFRMIRICISSVETLCLEGPHPR